MRNTVRALALALCAASCGEATTGPFYATKAAPPAGLPVALQILPPPSDAADTLAIAASGDSVSASALLGTSGCMDYSVVAGQVKGTLVITVIEIPSNRLCLLVETPATVRAVVRLLPRGEYRVEYRRRIAPPQQATVERVLGRRSVRLP
ncbi:MAG: hypothetical protein IT355_08070 [Gemmatimonadaceae bacterium]|nr:hypothetical protein [Gemmatimonadaceae bacterium]